MHLLQLPANAIFNGYYAPTWMGIENRILGKIWLAVSDIPNILLRILES